MKEYIIDCVFCSKQVKLNLDENKVSRWMNGELIQRVFPDMSAEERELMISNICPLCQKKMFGGDEDE